MCSYIVVVRSYYILLRCINICVCLGLLFSQDKIMMFAAVFCTDIYKLITTYRLWSKMGNPGFLAHNCILHWVLYLSFFGFPLFASIVHDSSIFACSLHVCTSTCMHPCSLESVDAWCVFTACLARNMVKQTPLPHNLNKWKKKDIYIYSIIVTKYNGLLFKLSRVEIVIRIIHHSQCPRGIPPIVMCNILISINMFVLLNRSEVVTTTPSGELKHFGWCILAIRNQCSAFCWSVLGDDVSGRCEIFLCSKDAMKKAKSEPLWVQVV